MRYALDLKPSDWTQRDGLLRLESIVTTEFCRITVFQKITKSKQSDRESSDGRKQRFSSTRSTHQTRPELREPRKVPEEQHWSGDTLWRANFTSIQHRRTRGFQETEGNDKKKKENVKSLILLTTSERSSPESHAKNREGKRQMIRSRVRVFRRRKKRSWRVERKRGRVISPTEERERRERAIQKQFSLYIYIYNTTREER